MKKIIFSILVLSVALSCQQEITQYTVKDTGVVYASIDDAPGTKTALNEFNNVVWTNGNCINVFDKSTVGDVYYLKDEFVGKNFGEFEPLWQFDQGEAIDHYVAFYPAYEFLECRSLDAKTYEISDVWIDSYIYDADYVAGTFINNTFPMVAVSKDNNFQFKNILGGIKFQLTGTQKLKSILIKGLFNDYKLAGLATFKIPVDGSDPYVEISDEYFSSYVMVEYNEGVQLQESVPTEFILPLPPVTFKDGFVVSITDTDGLNYSLYSFKENSIIRSKLLVMPPVELENHVFDCSIDINVYNVRLYERESAHISAELNLTGYNGPLNPTLKWSTEDPGVATVDQNGNITAISAGETFIILTAEPFHYPIEQYLSVEVLPSAECTSDYIDEYGIDHGKGVALGNVIWAPVNCGYHQTDFKYGKLYQWGRKYGIGYSGPLGKLYDSKGNELEPEGTYSDAIVPTVLKGPVSLDVGQSELNSNKIITSNGKEPFDWLDVPNDRLWNAGTEYNPKKTEYDPCPEGWRVPTFTEYEESYRYVRDRILEEYDGVKGVTLCLQESYNSYIPHLFLPLAGNCVADSILLGNDEISFAGRDWMTSYWSSTIDDAYPYPMSSFGVSNGDTDFSPGGVFLKLEANPVRCVQE